MNSKLRSSNFYPAMLIKLFMIFAKTGKEEIKAGHSSADNSPSVVDQMLLQDAVWHRSKSARYQQN